MQEKKFNLLYEPWIMVLNQEGGSEEVSLLTALERAHELRRLAGELPTQDVAILRLLLATLFATFTRADVDGVCKPLQDAKEALERWKDLWELKRFPMEPVKKRLGHYEDRFFLFHPERPFYQVAGLHEKTGKVNTISQIVSDIPSRPERRFLSMKSGENAEILSIPEAARWLVSMQAWDYAGKKASVVGGNPNGGGTGWLGKIGVVYPALDTLFETLLLNLVLLAPGGEILPYGSPFWEDENPPTPQKKERRPSGYCELLTWQSRRTRLFPGNGNNAGLVTGVLYSYGDVFQPLDMRIEQMTGWYRSKKGNTKGHYLPSKHRKERALWRDLGSLLPQASASEDKLNPGVIQWIACLKDENKLPDIIIRLCAVGFHYGAMEAKVGTMTADALSIHSSIFAKIGDKWMPIITNLLQLTDRCVYWLSILAADLAKAAGDSEAGAGSTGMVKTEAYYRMDEPFRKWLAGIDPLETNLMEAEQKWKDILKRIILQLGAEIASQAGEKAIVGRWVEERRGSRQEPNLYTAPGALARFRRNVGRTLREGG